MMSIRSLLLLLLVSLAAVSAFTTPPKAPKQQLAPPSSSTTSAFVFNKKPKNSDVDLSDMEVRDMTREEMAALNAENERVMNAELVGMTAFSLIISLPMFYLVWVAFFSETAEMNIDM